MLLDLITARPLFLQTSDQDTLGEPAVSFWRRSQPVPSIACSASRTLKQIKCRRPVNPFMHTIGYYEHSGGNDAIPAHWAEFLSFMEKHLRLSRN